MKHLLIAAALLAAVASPVRSSAETAGADAVMAPVNKFLDGFNTGNTKEMQEAGAPLTAILDEFPPHIWTGPGALDKWLSDFDVDAKKNGITDPSVTFGKPAHIDFTADRAYVVIPTDYSYKRNGKPDGEVGSTITLTLQKTSGSWLITGWAWTKH